MTGAAKWFGIYWVIGCVIFGAAIQLRSDHCPSEKGPKASEAIVIIAAWPMIFGMALAAPNLKAPACEQ
jgi:hypothetical protein